jgi:hypothetical protein
MHTVTKMKMRSFTIDFEYENKVFTFKYNIEKEDYECFYAIVSDFFTDEEYLEFLVGGENTILTAFPDLENKIEVASNLRELFGRDFCVGGIRSIDLHMYRISWCT